MRTVEDAVLPRALPSVLELAGLVQNALLPLLDRLSTVQNLRKNQRSSRSERSASKKQDIVGENASSPIVSARRCLLYTSDAADE